MSNTLPSSHHSPAWAPLQVPHDRNRPFTDYTRWRLKVSDGGRHIWHFLRTDEEVAAWPQNMVDKYWLGLETGLPALPKATTPYEAARNGYEFYQHLQSEDGHWSGEYGGPMFLLPGVVIGSYISNMGFTVQERLEMIRYLMNKANEDGGWGLHIEGPSTVFGTGMNYVAIRLLGMDAEHPVAVKARKRLHELGGATGIPAWGKFWFSLLGVYDWAGNNPVPPELWLLPDWMPIHPHRWWIHVRQVFLPMSYLYGVRFVMPENDMVLNLREELYPEDYYGVYWPSQRNNIASVDIYHPHTKLYDALSEVLSLYENCSFPPLRRRAVDCAYKLIVWEDENTSYQDLAPVNKMFNLVARFHRDGIENDSWRLHEVKRRDFMWMGPQGMMVCGTNGSQLWDTGFIIQALVETGLATDDVKYRPSLMKALDWLDKSQMRDNPKHFEKAYRHRTKGAFGFSTQEQGYTVSDCTGEGIKSVMYLQNHLDFTPKPVSEARIQDAIDTILSLQNGDGGFASYELIRAGSWMENLNPAEVFGKIMVEYNYPECTTSAITPLAIFRKHYPNYRVADIDLSIQRAVHYLHAAQTPEGGWVGNWGICFTYAAMFATESLALVGETYTTSPYSKKACEFLISKQREDGGWGESYQSCEQNCWVEHKDTQVVQSCWAIMALMYAKYPYIEPIERGVKMVMDRQLPDGSWAQEAIEGVFNKSCAISYPNFKFSFPIWMLGKVDKYLQQLRAGKLPTNGVA
ncbi:lanosterol synthase [Coprinellus micaceus]|uniref:Terpene cyclase/mutase family member n=1 Tax=Coprinellus micaceus TaxID=71717 RepID=A0A4Y7T4P2_COPMI|nr:lanosterol synthase [Coprinellus micaceus]